MNNKKLSLKNLGYNEEQINILKNLINNFKDN